VLDGRTLLSLGENNTDKPFGILFFNKPKEVQVDPNTGLAVAPAAPSKKAIKAGTKAGFEPDDKINFQVGIVAMNSLPSQLILRLTIPSEQCPTDLDPIHIGGGNLSIKVKLMADNFAEHSARIEPIYDANTDTYTTPLDQLPYIVRRTHKFEESRNEIFKVTLSISDFHHTIVSENLMNGLLFQILVFRDQWISFVVSLPTSELLSLLSSTFVMTTRLPFTRPSQNFSVIFSTESR
jgi:hypothetical protein